MPICRMSSLITDRSLLWLGALLYLAGFLTGLVGLTKRQSPAGLRTILNSLLVGGWVFQMLGLYLRGLGLLDPLRHRADAGELGNQQIRPDAGIATGGEDPLRMPRGQRLQVHVPAVERDRLGIEGWVHLGSMLFPYTPPRQNKL